MVMQEAKIDELTAEVEQLRAERDGLAAEVERLKAQAVPEGWASEVAIAYGHLWHANTEPGTPALMYSPERAATAARRVLLKLLTNDQRRAGIQKVGAMLAAAPKPEGR